MTAPPALASRDGRGGCSRGVAPPRFDDLEAPVPALDTREAAGY